ncbi:uncharacterized protein [Haliotis asinina]|uniref:uncharacterized protein n=1 Tax=Haliotis asinina TaxID=109174 RepID=UPI003531A582
MPRVQPQHVTPSSDGSKQTTYPRSVLHILNPVITLMRICGVCTGQRVTVEDIGCSDYRFRLLHKDGWFHTLYCVFLNSYLWIYTGILAYRLALLVTMSSAWIIVFQLLVLNITTSSFCTWASLNYRNGMHQSWVKDFYLYEQCYGVHEKMEDMVKKSRILVACFMSTGISMPLSLFTYALVIPEVGDMLCVVDRSWAWWNYLITIINYIILFTSASCSVIQSVIGSYPLCSELDVINTIMERYVTEYIKHQESHTFRSKSVSECHNEKNEQLRIIIGRHKHICRLISGFGDSIAYMQFTGLFMSLPLSCFSLYVIMTRIESQSNVILCVSLLVLCSLICIVVSIVGVRVNVKAHAALKHMLQIPTVHLNETTMRAVNQFTSLLTGTTIGYNVYGLFTISPPTVLSIVGTLVTYVVVVLQFRPPDSQTSLMSLCQDLMANVTLLLEDMRNASSCS